MRRYLLVVERNHNDYVPIDWSLLPSMENIDIFDLEEIDKFTSRKSLEALKEELYEEHLIDLENLDKPFAIIYEENERKRKIPYGPIDDKLVNIMDPQEILSILVKNISNKNHINRIYTYYQNKTVSSILSNIIDNIKNSSEISILTLVTELQKLTKIPYFERREFALLLNKVLDLDLPQVDNKNQLRVTKKV